MSHNRSFTAYDLVEYGQSGEECYGTYDSTTPTNSTGLGYTTACIHTGANSGTNGNNTVWYNYAAASAGTIVTPGSSTDTTEATESICPKGWRLPTKTEASLISGTANVSIFTPIYGGTYTIDGLLNIETRGYWWVSTVYNAQAVYLFEYYNGGLYENNYTFRRSNANYVRCILR